MKKNLLILMVALFAVTYSAQAQESKVSAEKPRYEQVGSHHSFSVSTLYRLEYSYEYVWKSGMSLIGRIGAGSEVYSPSKNNYSLSNGFRLTIEPRFYLNNEDFFALKAGGAILIPNTPFKASMVPVYGIKRNFTKHWFCEFTIGGGVGFYSGNRGRHYFEPHLQFRLGFKI